MNKSERHCGESSSLRQLELLGVKAHLYPTERPRSRYSIQCVPARSKSVPPAGGGSDEEETSGDRSEEEITVRGGEGRIELPLPKLVIPRQSDEQLLNNRLLELYFKSLKLQQLFLLQKSNERAWNDRRLPKAYWYELKDEQFNHECHLNNQNIDVHQIPQELVRLHHERKQIKRLLDAYAVAFD